MKKSICFKTLVLSLIILFKGYNLFATNITIENIVIVERNDAEEYIIVQFDLSWDNSFRVDDGDNTNWDAAWVFMKYKLSSATNVTWGHATLNDDGHSIPGNYNSDIGTTEGVNKGIFIYHSVIFNGTSSLEGMRLRWNYGEDGLSSTDEVDIRVFGIEMVYVPQGNYYAGSGGSETNRFHAGGGADTEPFEVTNAAFQVENTSGHLYATGAIANGAFASGFPNGYNAYYVMKHSITQQAYVDFLNTLSYADQDARTATAPNITGYLHNQYRHKIQVLTAGTPGSAPAVYSTDNPYVANGFMSKDDFLSYLDWAAVRPMTELEYEKAARGPSNPVADEYAWGNTRIGAVNDVVNPGAENEGPNTANTGYQRDITINHNYIDNDLTNFPLLIKLNNTNFDFSKCRPDGYDIRFYDALGNTLSYQRERHDEPNEKAEYWVKVPSISSSENTTITLEYGNSGASDGEDAANVWNDGNFVSVWHLQEQGDGTADEYKDAQGSNEGQGTGTFANRQEGQLGYDQEFPGDAAISISDDATLDLDTRVTISAWVKPQVLANVTLSESVAADWTDNFSMTNLAVDGDSLIVNTLDSFGIRIATPISLDSIKKAGSTNISWVDDDGYYVEAYTNSGNFKVPSGVTEVDVLVVAGGGGGGGSPLAGGGGAGGVVYESGYSVTPGQNIGIVVGNGGNGNTGPTAAPWQQTDAALCGDNGENSSFGSIVAIGGGGGGRYQNLAAKDGGSGGGAGYLTTGASAEQPASASGGDGNDGGDAAAAPNYGSGGGGGASEAGTDGITTQGGDGGDGVYYGNIFGDQYGENGYFAGGGGGSVYNSTNSGSGGNGGGGDGGNTATAAQDAISNTGGGGGGAERAHTGKGGDGGSGIVLIRYKHPDAVKIYTSVSDNNTTGYPGVQIFRSGGTFSVPANVTEVEVLVVAGGGAGGDNSNYATQTAAGGGGGGGVVYNSAYSVTPGANMAVTVGAGGTVNVNGQGGDGGNSIFGTITATGGGGGGWRNGGDGRAGGSGGGAGYDGTPGIGSQGSDGGDDYNATPYNAGGGGGANETGNSANVNYGGDGGDGIAYDISGILTYYGGGGGGGAGNTAPTGSYGLGGQGGGGNGGHSGSTTGTDGVSNTGGGGGGSGSNGSSAGAGGSGIVIIRWGDEAASGSDIPSISQGDDLTGKYLWVMQQLSTNNPVYTPSLKSMNLEIKGEADIAGKGQDAFNLSIHDGSLLSYINDNSVSSSITNNTYQHVAVTYDGSFQRIYINGLLTGNSSLSGAITTNANNFFIGTNMKGIIDEVRLSDTARSQAWLKAEYHNGNLDLITVGGEGALSNVAANNGASYPTVGAAGPLRVGFGATATSSRTAAGASYWGIMELSGNLWERPITVGNASGQAFTGLHGDGALNSGTFNVANWNLNGVGLRGGAFNHASTNELLRISCRTYSVYTGNVRSQNRGGRGARTAP